MTSEKEVIAISPLREEDFGPVGELATRIWLAHYISIITKEQIEYMLQGRFAPANLRRYIGAKDRWMDLLRTGSELAGYCSYSLTAHSHEMKLEQVYLAPELHGQGLGTRMLDHVETQARLRGCRTLMLTVNKQNEKAIKAYLRSGFQVREEAVFDIGNGFVMDDYVMAKALDA